MKRDWKLIRAILLQEPKDGWDGPTIVHHRVLCAERGLTGEITLQDHEGYKVVSGPGLFLTKEGQRIADALTNAEDLDAVLNRLDRLHLGHSEEIILSLMREKALARLEASK